MSEIVVDEDPEPLSGTYPINYETGLSFEGYKLADELAREEDKSEIVKLSLQADAILTRAGYGLDEEDVRVKEEFRSLRRRIAVYEEDGRFRVLKSYFYIDASHDPRYCRSWTNESDRVNYCLNKQQHERAFFVRTRLEEIFPEPPITPESRQLLGSQVLAKLLRRT